MVIIFTKEVGLMKSYMFVLSTKLLIKLGGADGRSNPFESFASRSTWRTFSAVHGQASSDVSI